MKLEIEKKKKLPKNKIKSLDMILFDLSPIKLLVGNKIILEHTFQLTKNECLNG
jgi:hypothetical protein